MSYLAASCAFVAAAWTVLAPGLLNGPAVMNGSARGTALVVLVVAAPVLLVSTILSARGSDRALVVRAGSLAYLLYNALLLVFMTPFNAAFLVYVAMLSAALWSIVALWASVDVSALGARFSSAAPVRAVAVYVWVVAGLNAAAWLRMVVPGLTADYPPDFLVGTGTTTNTLHVQDLAVWLPLAAVAALWLWHRQSRGLVVVSALLTLWIIEGVSVAVDQRFGHRADPASDVVSDAAVLPFLLLALVGLVPLFLLLRRFGETGTAGASEAGDT